MAKPKNSLTIGELKKRCGLYFANNKPKEWAPRKFRNYVGISSSLLNWYKNNKPEMFELFHRNQSVILAHLEWLALYNKVNGRVAMELLKAYDADLYRDSKFLPTSPDGTDHITINVKSNKTIFDSVLLEQK